MAGHTRPAHRIADILRRHTSPLMATHVLTLDQRRLLGAIRVCRTPALGGQLHHCPACAEVHPVFHSCRKRGCPNCQALSQEAWITARAERILPIKHFHVIFTLPSELRRLAKGHPTDVYNAFFRVVGELLEELAMARYGIQLGWTAVLHTWRRDMGYHAHLHALVTAGGLSADGGVFRPIRETYLFPGDAMGRMLRGKMLDALRGLFAAGKFPELDDDRFDVLMASLAKHKSWVVHVQPPFRDASHLLGYLGRYVHRIALSDTRLVAVSDERVTFTTKDGKTASMPPVTFLQRFLQHALPQGFHKVRHGGLYASARKGGRLDQTRALLEQEFEPEGAEKRKDETVETSEKPTLEGIRCPTCDGVMVPMKVRLPRLRAPPGGTNA